MGFDEGLEGCFSVCEDFPGFDVGFFIPSILFSDVLDVNTYSGIDVTL
jgi:hypothetical protein